MQSTRKRIITFPGGEIYLRIDVYGELFSHDTIAPVLDELESWSVGSIHDNLTPKLMDALQAFDGLLERGTDEESYMRLVIDGNAFDISVTVALPLKLPANIIKALIIQSVTGDAVGQFTDLVAAKLAEGSLPDDARFRALISA